TARAKGANADDLSPGCGLCSAGEVKMSLRDFAPSIGTLAVGGIETDDATIDRFPAKRDRSAHADLAVSATHACRQETQSRDGREEGSHSTPSQVGGLVRPPDGDVSRGQVSH